MPFRVPICYCITNNRQKNRYRNFQKRQSKKKQYNVVFFDEPTIRPKNKKMSKETLRLTSYVKIIREAQRKKLSCVMIMQDTAKILSTRLIVKNPPNDWDMLMLSGKVQQVFPDPETDQSSDWKRVSCVDNICFIVNTTIYSDIINEAKNFTESFDQLLQSRIHPNKRCYLIQPQLVSHLDTSVTSTTLLPFTDPFTIDQVSLVNNVSEQDDLPKISIVTPTHNHNDIFPLAVMNFFKTRYPQELLEWVIVDDSDTPVSVSLPPELTQLDNVKYISCKTTSKMTIGAKRNVGVSYSTSDIIINMDDDDYFYPDAFEKLVRTLLTSEGKKCLGAGKLPIMRLHDGLCTFNYKNTESNKHNQLWEGTLIYYKDFWNARNYDETIEEREGDLFLNGRMNEVGEYTDTENQIMVALAHSSNHTRNYRFVVGCTQQDVFYRKMPGGTQEFMLVLQHTC